MVVTDNRVTLGDVLIMGALGPVLGLAYLVDRGVHRLRMKAAKQRADKAAAERKAKRSATAAKRKQPKRATARKVRRIKTAKDHRQAFGAPPALRIINGGKA